MFCWCWRYFSQRIRRLKICSVVLLPVLKPASFSAMIFSDRYDLQHDCAWVAYESDCSVVLAGIVRGWNHKLLLMTLACILGEIIGMFAELAETSALALSWRLCKWNLPWLWPSLRFTLSCHFWWTWLHFKQGFLQLHDIGGQRDPHLSIIGGHRDT